MATSPFNNQNPNHAVVISCKAPARSNNYEHKIITITVRFDDYTIGCFMEPVQELSWNHMTVETDPSIVKDFNSRENYYIIFFFHLSQTIRAFESFS